MIGYAENKKLHHGKLHLIFYCVSGGDKGIVVYSRENTLIHAITLA